MSSSMGPAVLIPLDHQNDMHVKCHKMSQGGRGWYVSSVFDHENVFWRCILSHDAWQKRSCPEWDLLGECWGFQPFSPGEVDHICLMSVAFWCFLVQWSTKRFCHVQCWSLQGRRCLFAPRYAGCNLGAWWMSSTPTRPHQTTREEILDRAAKRRRGPNGSGGRSSWSWLLTNSRWLFEMRHIQQGKDIFDLRLHLSLSLSLSNTYIHIHIHIHIILLYTYNSIIYYNSIYYNSIYNYIYDIYIIYI